MMLLSYIKQNFVNFMIQLWEDTLVVKIWNLSFNAGFIGLL